MARPDMAIPLLRQAYISTTGAAKLDYAEALGVMGDGAGLQRALDLEGAAAGGGLGGGRAVGPVVAAASGPSGDCEVGGDHVCRDGDLSARLGSVPLEMCHGLRTGSKRGRAGLAVCRQHYLKL